MGFLNVETTIECDASYYQMRNFSFSFYSLSNAYSALESSCDSHSVLQPKFLWMVARKEGSQL